MDTEIIVALIGAAAMIIAAIIGVLGKEEKTTNIEQKVSGNGNTVIGTQINNDNSEQLEKLQNTVETLQKGAKKPELVTVELPNKAGGTTVIIGASEDDMLQAIEKELAEI